VRGTPHGGSYPIDEPVKNRLFSALPATDRDRLRPQLHRVDVPQRHTLDKVGGPARYFYFVEEGIVSVMATVDNEDMSEIGLVGPEGIIGTGALLGAPAWILQKITQCPCVLLRIDASACKAVFDGSPVFQGLVLRRLHAYSALTAQISVCNRFHNVKHRLARRVLMASDRVGSNIVFATQEFLALALGVRRIGITAAAVEFRRAKLIRYHGGEIEILDRQGLESEACSCYRKDQEWYSALLSGNA
jgi:CRP-like cAMP-binding protein